MEYARARKIRERNINLYRLAPWAIWIWVFFWCPALTFTLFARGCGGGNLTWLALVLAGNGPCPVCVGGVRSGSDAGRRRRIAACGAFDHGRRYGEAVLYGSVWAVTVAQTLLLAFWQVLPSTRTANFVKLVVFVGALLLMALAAYRGALPRTRYGITPRSHRTKRRQETCG